MRADLIDSKMVRAPLSGTRVYYNFRGSKFFTITDGKSRGHSNGTIQEQLGPIVSRASGVRPASGATGHYLAMQGAIGAEG